MATHSPPSSPPVAKRPKLDAEAPAELSPARPGAASTANANANVNGTQNGTPVAAKVPANDEESDSEDEELPQPVKEEEDVARRDMYLDTVSGKAQAGRGGAEG